MQPLGKQFLAELYKCDQEILNNVEMIQSIMQQAADSCGATIVDSKFHRFSPHGVSGMVLIAESHLAIHTWPEYGYAAFDLFTCSSKLDSVRCLKHIEQKLNAETCIVKKMDRGFVAPISGKNSCASF
ncbi:MAG: adenosylmethionine decarboxylase [Proteobacteria bacterium]|nr:adenosylmethionine decarboxylase [Pseudomonadota bacterium]